MASQPFAAMAGFVIVCMGGLVGLNLAIMARRSDRPIGYLARFQSEEIYSSYHSLIDL